MGIVKKIVKLFILLFVFHSVKANTIEIKNDQNVYNIKSKSSIAFVNSLKFNLDTINFTPYSEIKVKRQKGVVLLNFKISKSLIFDQLFLNATYIDSVVVFTKENGNWQKIQQRSGFMVPMENKSVKNARTTLVPLPISQNTETTFVVALCNVTKTGALGADVSAKIGLQLYTREGLSIFNTHRNMAFFVSGILFLMIVVNGGIVILGKRKSYLYLVIYNVVFLLAIIFTNGLFHELGLLNSTKFSRLFRLLMWNIAPVFYLLFGIHYLQLKKRLPNAYKLVCIILIMNVLCLIPFLFSNISLVFNLMPYLSPIAAVVLFIVALFLLKSGFVPAKFMIFASLLLFLGYAFIFMGIKFNIIPFVYTELLMVIFFMLELSVFTIAIFSDLRHSEQKNLFELQKRLDTEQALNKKNRELISANLQLLSNDTQIDSIISQSKGDFSQLKNQFKQIKNSNKNWDNIFKHFLEVEPLFFNQLSLAYPKLTNNDLKLCAFLKMNLTTKEIASINGVTEVAVSKSRNRLRKKLNMLPGEDILAFLHKNSHSKGNV
jgi:biopolymer transport protein ExbD